MRYLLLLAILFSTSNILALPCSETPEFKTEIMPEMEKISAIDKKGDEDLKAALANFQKVSKKDEKQMAAYAAAVVSKPEFSQLQQDRQNLGLKTLSLMSGTDCSALAENNKKLKSAVSLQWLGVLTAIKADTQVYMAKKFSNMPDINATTDAGEKVVLHADGTWSEHPKNNLKK